MNLRFMVSPIHRTLTTVPLEKPDPKYRTSIKQKTDMIFRDQIG